MAQQAGGPIPGGTGQQKPKKGSQSPGSNSGAQPSADNQKVTITGIAPVFLESNTNTQYVRIEGQFADPANITVSASDPLTVSRFSVSDTELLLQVQLTSVDATTKEVELYITYKSGSPTPTVVPLTVRSACTGHAAIANTLPTPPPAWDTLCALPKGVPECQAFWEKPGRCVFGINALTHQRTTAVTADFCKNTWSVSDSFRQDSTYMTTRDSAVVIVCNQNPFRWAITLSRNDTAIKDDDASVFLGVLDPLTGLSNATSQAQKAATMSNSTTQQNTPAGNNQAHAINQPHQAASANPPTLKTYTWVRNKSNTFEQTSAPFPFALTDPVQECVDDIASAVKGDDYGAASSTSLSKGNPTTIAWTGAPYKKSDTIDVSIDHCTGQWSSINGTYQMTMDVSSGPPPTTIGTINIDTTNLGSPTGCVATPVALSKFIDTYNQSKVSIEDDSIECSDRVGAAKTLWIKGQSLPTDDLGKLQQEISSLKQEIAYRQGVLKQQKGALADQETATLAAQNTALDNQACVVSQMLGATSTIQQNVVDPIQNVLGTNGSFIYMSTDVSKDHDPVERVWKLSSTLKPTSILAKASDIASNPYATNCPPAAANKQQPQQPNPEQSTNPNPGGTQSNPTPAATSRPTSAPSHPPTTSMRHSTYL